MIQSVEASLTRLGMDYLDLLWAHWPDPLTPTEEILGGFDQLVSSGNVLYAGLSKLPCPAPRGPRPWRTCGGGRR